MLDRLIANHLFRRMLKRPDISAAYAMKDESDSWYDTLCKVHNALAEIQTLPHETVEITSADGLSLKAIHYPNREPNAKNATVIFVHGYTSHAEREWAFPGLFYHAAGYHVLIPYQRAHGISEGTFISLGALEREDMLRWMEKAQLLHPETQVVIHGLSMGGNIALELTNAADPHLKCVISDAPSMGGDDWFAHIARSRIPGARRVAAQMKARFAREFGKELECTEVTRYVNASRCPILLAAGSMENREEEFAALRRLNPCETVTVILPGCSHGNGMYKQTAMFQEALSAFLNRYIR